VFSYLTFNILYIDVVAVFTRVDFVCIKTSNQLYYKPFEHKMCLTKENSKLKMHMYKRIKLWG